MLFGFLIVLFVIVCVILCLLILIQSDKGGGISGAVGGGLSGASNLLGTQDTANILTRGTAIFGVAFLILCILLSLTFNRKNVVGQKSILQERAEKQATYSPSSILNNGSLPLQGTPNAAGGAATTAPESPVGENVGGQSTPVLPPANAK
ncbi:MAG TPA: preprotein translocase subunit SecG [Chitinispirillaceae bacterium]|nr:preprotein translocase subunit SecG [Chitinispirillaceae bacterium]